MKRVIFGMVVVLGLINPRANAAVADADEYYEITADIDGDGIADRLTSEPIRSFGSAGGRWQVLLGTGGGGFVAVGMIFADPRALRAEQASDFVRLWVYSKSSGTSGLLGYYVLKDGRVGDFKAVEISPGDGGTEIGRSIYDAVFPVSQRYAVVRKKS